jgi:chorismate--pyruvate lyase
MPKPAAWLPPPRYWQARPPRTERAWLLCEGSLTAALVALSHGAFRVRVTHEGWHRPRPDERQALQLSSRHFARIREVELLSRDQVWVTARSIIPQTTLHGRGRRLRYLGSRSLGTVLFKEHARREPLDIRHQDGDWQRRSCFRFHGRPLLVQERFLPALFAAAQAAKLR